MQKGGAEGEEKTKSPAGAETERGTGVQKGEVEGEQKMKSPAGAGNSQGHRRAKK
ncbi:hypothetical protein [Bianquea renquensis]|uniref:Uncharacterized protein n=1 Tax=Bianquea renquensis TaxID=2763661 RepID=A0A926DVD8_9FIRM|nr:hypothetical protein [Bianquea renquensis]MBC8544542.1 hypothetical protein [Bianquea renquensis]